MDYRLKECLSGNSGNYLFPFFIVQDTETTDRMLDELHAIYNAGIRSAIIHSHEYEAFCEEQWWNDVRALMEEAKRLGMKLWILDTKRFPSGNVGKLLEKKFHRYRPWGITEFHMEVVGPIKEGSATINHLKSGDGEIVCILACKLAPNQPQVLTGDIIDITDGISGDMVYFDLPEGVWRIVMIYKTQEGINDRFMTMVNKLIPEPTKIYIEEVFESHYRHFKEYFGNTFEGFFCDEPGFHNNTNFGFSTPIGQFGAHYPWDDSVLEEMKETFGDRACAMLASLWFQFENDGHVIPRNRYMNIITDKYRDNFTNQIAAWCRDHNVKYVGHIVEDNDIHAQTGASPAHYFKALDGMDMAGVDVVLHQIMPGMKDYSSAGYVGYKHMDNTFFHYYLAKLGSSMAHNDPKKKGRALCELFGAYGWAEGSKMMRYLADHMLVRGINYLVPHMFIAQIKGFANPSMDCPPHFYSGGKNPMYPYLKHLMGYMNRMCHLFNDGEAKISCALVYDAPGLWSRGKKIPLSNIAKVLYDNQLDYDIVPLEYSDEVFAKYPLVIAFGRRGFSEAEVTRLETFGTVFADELENLEDLLTIAEEKGIRDVFVGRKNEDLKCYHYIRDGAHYCMFVNENIHHAIRETVRLSDFIGGEYVLYDAMLNKAERCCSADGSIVVELEPYNSLVVAFGNLDSDGMEPHQNRIEDYSWEVDCEYAVSVSYHNENNFQPYKTTKELFNMTGRYEKPDFSGHMKYEFTLDVPEIGNYTLDLGYVGEMAELFVNGESAGVRFGPPYRFEIGKFLVPGENQVVVDVANHYGFEKKDVFSKFIMYEPSGMMGPVTLKKYHFVEE